MLSVLARLATRRAPFLLAGGFLLAALAGFLGAPVTGLLHGGSGDFVTPGSESLLADERLARATGVLSDGGLVALVRLDDPVEAPSSRARVERVAATMSAHPAFARVTTFYSSSDPTMISRDQRSTYVLGHVRSSAPPAEAVG